MKSRLLWLIAITLILSGCKDDEEKPPTTPKFENLNFSNAKGYYHGVTDAGTGNFEIILYTGTLDEKDALSGQGRQLTIRLYSDDEIASGTYSAANTPGTKSTFLTGTASNGTKFRIIDQQDQAYNITGGELNISASEGKVTSVTFNFTSTEDVIISGGYTGNIQIKDMTDPDNKIEDITFESARGYYYGKEEGSDDPEYYELFFYTGKLGDDDGLTGQGNLLRLCVYSGEELADGTYGPGNGTPQESTFVTGTSEEGTKITFNDAQGNTVYAVTGGSAVIERPTGTSIEIDFKFTSSSGWELSGAFSGNINITDKSPQKPPIEDPNPEGYTKFGYAFAHYYGDHRDTGTGMFRIVLSDIDSERYANESIWIVGFCDLADDPDNFELPVGTYTIDLSLTGDPFTFWPGTKNDVTGYLDNTFYYYRQGTKRNYLADGGTITVSKEEDYYTILTELDTYRTVDHYERMEDLKYYYFGQIEFENDVVGSEPELYEPENSFEMVSIWGGEWGYDYHGRYKTAEVMGVELIFTGYAENNIHDEVIFNLSVPSYDMDYGNLQTLLPAGTYTPDMKFGFDESYTYIPGVAEGSVTFSRYSRRLGSSTIDLHINVSLEEGDLTISYTDNDTMLVTGTFTGSNTMTGQPASTELNFEVEISSVVMGIYL